MRGEKCHFCGRLVYDYFTAFYHRLQRRITICHDCLKKYTPINWNGLKDEIEMLYLERERMREERR